MFLLAMVEPCHTGEDPRESHGTLKWLWFNINIPWRKKWGCQPLARSDIFQLLSLVGQSRSKLWVEGRIALYNECILWLNERTHDSDSPTRWPSYVPVSSSQLKVQSYKTVVTGEAGTREVLRPLMFLPSLAASLGVSSASTLPW